MWNKEAALDLPMNETTAAFKVEWPAVEVCFLKLELRDDAGKLHLVDQPKRARGLPLA